MFELPEFKTFHWKKVCYVSPYTATCAMLIQPFYPYMNHDITEGTFHLIFILKVCPVSILAAWII
jgi:hypothetical protein